MHDTVQGSMVKVPSGGSVLSAKKEKGTRSFVKTDFYLWNCCRFSNIEQKVHRFQIVRLFSQPVSL